MFRMYTAYSHYIPPGKHLQTGLQCLSVIMLPEKNKPVDYVQIVGVLVTIDQGEGIHPPGEEIEGAVMSLFRVP
jgi:hypothetical protein